VRRHRSGPRPLSLVWAQDEKFGLYLWTAFTAGPGAAAVAVGVGVNQDDSAAKIATALYDHRGRLLVSTLRRYGGSRANWVGVAY